MKRRAAGAVFVLLLAVPGCAGEAGGGGDGAESDTVAWGTSGGDSSGPGAASGIGTTSAPVPGTAAAGASARPGESGEWPLYGGDPAQTRFSPLEQIGPDRVGEMERVWSHPLGSGIAESTPVVAGDALYLTTPLSGGDQRILRLNAATGEREWETALPIGDIRGGPAYTNRGAAVADGRVFVATLDARLVALDARTGDVLWQTRTADPSRGYSHKQAPLVHDGVIYLGAAGSPYGIRGFVKAFDAASGRELWTWHSIPSPEEGGWWGEWTETLPGTDRSLGRDVASERADSARFAESWRRGGGAVWMTPTLDVERGLLFVGTGNPAPELTDRTRPGDNRWTVSVCALRADEGTTEWCYQLVPHDVWGMDAASPPFLFEVEERSAGERADDGTPADGAGEGAAPIPAVGHFSKMGVFYAWDRRTGELLARSDPYVPHENFLARPTPEGVEIAPGIYGGTEWSPAAYSPVTRRAYAANLHAPGRYFVRTEGARAGSIGFDLGPASERGGNLTAVDPTSGEILWQAEVDEPMVGGVVVTAGGLVFAGRLSGSLEAWDAESGEPLWSGGIGPPCASAPMTYAVDGRQYVAITCGGHFLASAGVAGQGRLAVFALPPDGDPRP